MEEDFIIQQRYKKQIQKVVKKKLPKINGRVGALPPLDQTAEGEDNKELSSKRARSLQDKPGSILSPAPELRNINLTKVEGDTRDISPDAKAEDKSGTGKAGGQEETGDNSTVVIAKQKNEDPKVVT